MTHFSHLACLALLLSTGAVAQIYETTDSEGNTVFTDTPTLQSQEVDLPDANIADAVKPSPSASTDKAPAPHQPKEQVAEEEDDGVYIIGNSRNDELEEKITRERRKDVLDGNQRRDALDGKAPSGVAHPVRHRR